MEKYLPLKINCSITTECWSFYRFAIIEAYPNLTNWTIQHYNHLFADEHLELFYGANGQKYDQYNCYSPVLNIKGLFREEILPEQLVPFIKRQIDKGIYVLVECEYGYLRDKLPGYIHEILVCGYDDDRQAFQSPILDGLKWNIAYITYNDLEVAYSILDDISLDCLSENLYRREYLMPITLITANTQYNVDYNLCSFYKDVMYICSESYKVHKTFIDELEHGKSFHGYWSCYNALLTVSNNILNDEKYYSTEYQYALYIKKLYDYRTKLQKDLSTLIKFFNISFDSKLTAMGKDIVKMLNICYMTAIKYNITKDKQCIKNIAETLYLAFYKEKEILLALFDTLCSHLIKLK